MSPRRMQQGMSFLEFVFYVLLAVFFGNLLFTVGPLYLDHYKVQGALKSLERDSDLATDTRDMIAEKLLKRLLINEARQVRPQDIAILKRGSYVKVQVVYDRTVHVFGNLDVTAHFNETSEFGKDPDS